MQWHAKHLGLTGLVLALGGGVGFVCQWIGTPLPFMLGSLLGSAFLSMVAGQHFPQGYQFPVRFRQAFVGVIGVMIGAQVSPDIVALLPTMSVTLPAIIAFIVIAHVGNTILFHKLGGFDRKTAFYAGAPGGLLESIAFGEEDGADLRLLTIMQFLRIIVVVVALPIAISLYEGAPVGSAAGANFGRDAGGVWDVAMTFGFALVGLIVGTWLKLPAAQLAGPLVLVGLASGFGLVSLTIPPWLLAVAQVVLGAGLGLRFMGLTRRMLVTGFGLSILSGSFMLALGLGLALLVHRLTGLDIETMIISFAPGGVTEMSLIALSLAANPAFVTFHHLVRIMGTVLELSLMRRAGWLQR